MKNETKSWTGAVKATRLAGRVHPQHPLVRRPEWALEGRMGCEEQWTRESLPQSTLNLPRAPQGGGFTTPTCPAVFHQPAPRAYCVSRSFSKREFSLHFPASPVNGNWEGRYGLMGRTAQLGRKWVRGTDKVGTPNLSLSPPGTQEATAQPPLELGCESVT